MIERRRPRRQKISYWLFEVKRNFKKLLKEQATFTFIKYIEIPSTQVIFHQMTISY